jgi:hypothetical protein
MITELCPEATACRYVEEELTAATKRGATQYLAIGRNCEVEDQSLSAKVRVLSVQDLDNEALSFGLERASFCRKEITFVSWLGGGASTPDAVIATLGLIASLPPSSTLVFDYAAMDALASQMGESCNSYIDPVVLRRLLQVSGFREAQDIGEAESGVRLVKALV